MKSPKSRIYSLMTAVLTVILAGVGLAFIPQTAAVAVVPTPIRAAFYYPWFPETEHWSSQFTPTLGKYESADPAVINKHIDMAQYAGLDAFISSWWGQGSVTDNRLPLILSTAAAKGFHVAPYYEQESLTPAPTDAVLASDLTYLAGLSSSPAWLKVSNRPVLFIYNTSNEASCAAVSRLEAINAGRFYISAKIFGGYASCATQPESWHQYGPASPIHTVGPFSSNVSPGFFKFNEAAPRLARDTTRFKANLATQLASGAQWQLITSFNEWGEGTSVEPAAQWSSASGFGEYLDAMHTAYGRVRED